MKKGKKQRIKHLERLDSILKGILDFKADKIEYERIRNKYLDLGSKFCNHNAIG